MASVTSDTVNIIIRMVNNSKHSDFHTSLPLTSTVYELKQNLSLTHPTKPSPKNQRLIYSGKLLEDTTRLHQIFKSAAQSTTSTVHMVLAAEISHQVAKSASTATATISENENELRQRKADIESTTNCSSISADNERRATDIQHSSAYEEYSQQLRAYNQQLQSFTMGPSNVNFLSNMAYLQYCSIYYQMHQNLLFSQSGNISGIYNPFSTVSSNSNQSQNVIQSQNSAASDTQRPPTSVQPPVAPVPPARPHAERAHNEREDDLLGTLHMLAELFVLCSIIYFYSTFHRFLIVFIIFAILYLHCRGYLTISRRRRRPPARHQTPPAVSVRPPQQPAQAQPDANQSGIQQQPPQEENQEHTEQTPTPQVPNEQPNGNDIQRSAAAQVPVVNDQITPVRLFFLAITAFFSSLIPERPQQRL